MMLSGGMGGQMGGQMNPLMLSLLLGDDVPKSKASYDKICASDPACAAEVAKIYNADGVSIFWNLAVLYQISLEMPFLQSFLVQSRSQRCWCQDRSWCHHEIRYQLIKLQHVWSSPSLNDVRWWYARRYARYAPTSPFEGWLIKLRSFRWRQQPSSYDDDVRPKRYGSNHGISTAYA